MESSSRDRAAAGGEDSRRICFVVMGFGVKTAYSADHMPRSLDLDATYEAIIRPAVEEAGFRCIRADQVLSSGMIDTRMYEMLLRADLVVADISTGNVNAVYELGVRHALRPYSTIIMQEDQAAFHFDLSHISTFTYHHLGSDIGNREARAKKEALAQRIRAITKEPVRDSPVYEFLRGLREPSMSREDYRKMLTVIEERGDRLQELIARGRERKKEGRMGEAATIFAEVLEILDTGARGGPGEDVPVGQTERGFVIQQLALTTYKSGEPDEAMALERALTIIERLDPDSSRDPETLGIAGAIRKRLWLLTRDRAHLDRAVEYYGRGFRVRNDYYTGENYALCLDLRAEVQGEESEAVYDRMTARKAREELVEHLETEIHGDDYGERSDRVWMHATLANALFGLSRDKEAEEEERRFRELADEGWMVETYEDGKRGVLRLRRGG